jgi:outer membrane protein assembly factor BamE
MFHPNYRFLPAAALCFALTACSNVPRFFNEYKIDVQQGNVLSQEMVAQLKPGQTKDQVRFLLGTPMIADIFHQQRWDYLYSFRNGATGQTQSRRFSVFFGNDGLLARVDGDVAVADVAELTTPVAKSRLLDLSVLPESGVPMPAAEEPSYYRRFMNMIGF